MEIYSFILVTVILILLITFTYGSFSGAPWVPTRKKDIKRIIEFSEIKKGMKFYEMGSGDGRLCAAVAENGCKAIGYEISIIPYIISKIRKIFLKERENYEIKWGNFWKANISEADCVYVFLRPDSNVKILKKFKKELKKGTKIIAYVWPFEGLAPLKVDKKEDRVNIYLYKI